ncbi:ester cyclase [Maribellus mangrovi]|uniref:ester cyclase n=1 Tax=Maribellus mangrovi TaxID=3133146 RepID=UPI0030EDA05F
MNLPEKNKQFMKKYYREMLYAKNRRPELLPQTIQRFIHDQKLIDHILSLNKSFPGYDVIIKDMIAEGDRVFVNVDFIGKHEGPTEGIPATAKEVLVPFALCYTIREEKIVDFWTIANEMEFFEQLGLTREQVEVQKASDLD